MLRKLDIEFGGMRINATVETAGDAPARYFHKGTDRIAILAPGYRILDQGLGPFFGGEQWTEFVAGTRIEERAA